MLAGGISSQYGSCIPVSLFVRRKWAGPITKAVKATMNGTLKGLVGIT